MKQKLFELKKVVSSIYALKQKEMMGFDITLDDIDKIPHILVKGKVKK